MKIKAVYSINVFDLFVHDSDSTHDLDERAVAKCVEKHLQSTLPYSEQPWRVIPEADSGLDRMVLQRGDWPAPGSREPDPERWAEKYANEERVRAAFPTAVVKALDALNKMTLTWGAT